MSEHEISDLAGPVAGLSPERLKALGARLPPYEARDKFEDGYLTGLELAARLLEDELPGPAAAVVRELLAVAARRIAKCRPQIDAIRAEVRSPEYRAWLEAESAKIVAGTADLRDFSELLVEMDEIVARAEAARTSGAAAGHGG